MVEDFDDPDVSAGFALVETVRAQLNDPLSELLDHAGLWAALRLLTTGSIPERNLQAYAEWIMTRPMPVVPHDVAIAAFAKAELRSAPYAYALDPTGETTLALIEADPRGSQGSRLVLQDSDWVRLQEICGQ